LFRQEFQGRIRRQRSFLWGMFVELQEIRLCRFGLFLERGKSLPGTFHEGKKSLRQFLNSLRFPVLNGVRRDQLRADANCRSSRDNETLGRMLRDAARGYEWNLGQGGFESLDVFVSSNLGTGKDLDEVRSLLPSLNHLGRGQGTWQNGDSFLDGKLDNLPIEPRARKKTCASIDTLARHLCMQDSARTHHQLWMVADEVCDESNCLGHRRCDFDNRYAAIRHGVGRKVRVLGRGDSYSRDYADLLN
ncbi:MAG TPA: hypothetical protein VLW83_18690, partial [Candidatus Acidoferrales bacterium]|nr:hypothetical protein [Candidatus Acidoferrales bacterium]